MTFEKETSCRADGFTLIELIIVIAILSILALIGLPVYTQYQQDAELRVADTNCATIGHAVEAYLARSGGITPSVGQLDPYLNSVARSALSSGDYTFSVTDGNVTVIGPRGSRYPSN